MINKEKGTISSKIKFKSVGDFFNAQVGDSITVEASSIPTFLLKNGQSTEIQGTATRLGDEILIEEKISFKLVQ